jgi:hypothetical protein
MTVAGIRIAETLVGESPENRRSQIIRSKPLVLLTVLRRKQTGGSEKNLSISIQTLPTAVAELFLVRPLTATSKMKL